MTVLDRAVAPLPVATTFTYLRVAALRQYLQGAKTVATYTSMGKKVALFTRPLALSASTTTHIPPPARASDDQPRPELRAKG